MAFLKQLTELSAAKAQIANQEKKLNEDRTRALASLHSEFGYADLKTFIKALTVASKTRKVKVKASAKLVKSAKRARLTPDTKLAIIEAAKANKSGAEIAKAFGVSIATVQNLKKAAGLVKKRA